MVEPDRSIAHPDLQPQGKPACSANRREAQTGRQPRLHCPPRVPAQPQGRVAIMYITGQPAWYPATSGARRAAAPRLANRPRALPCRADLRPTSVSEAPRRPSGKKILSSQTLSGIIKRVEGLRTSSFPQMCKTLWKVCESGSTSSFPPSRRSDVSALRKMRRCPRSGFAVVCSASPDAGTVCQERACGTLVDNTAFRTLSGMGAEWWSVGCLGQA